ncbi:hypothetical protein PMAYCL1PPCAC_19858, partial [Pristionchus mayeri]
ILISVHSHLDDLNIVTLCGQALETFTNLTFAGSYSHTFFIHPEWRVAFKAKLIRYYSFLWYLHHFSYNALFKFMFQGQNLSCIYK